MRDAKAEDVLKAAGECVDVFNCQDWIVLLVLVDDGQSRDFFSSSSKVSALTVGGACGLRSVLAPLREVLAACRLPKPQAAELKFAFWGFVDLAKGGQGGQVGIECFAEVIGAQASRRFDFDWRV